MPTSTKPVSQSPAKKQPPSPKAKSPSPPAEPPSPPAQPFLRFYHSDILRIRTLAVLTTLEQAPDCTRYRGALTDLAVQLTNSGMEYYFFRALELTKVGFVVEQSARLGLSGAMGVLTPIIRNVIGHMDQSQLLIVCSHIRQLME